MIHNIHTFVQYANDKNITAFLFIKNCVRLMIKTKITKYPSLDGTDLSSWGGKETADLIESIYEKINDIKIRFPHVSNNGKYLWGVRVNNIRKRIWLLLRHVSS